MDTPICDFVEEYRKKNVSRFHMPGHKGSPYLGYVPNLSQDTQQMTPYRIPIWQTSCMPWDITEIQGADDLYHAEGIILASEQNAASLFGSRWTFYSTEGSSLCIRAMLYLVLQLCKTSSRPRILAARNVHKTFLYACALLDLDVDWIYPESTSSLCSCPISPKNLQRRLLETAAAKRPLAVFVTSPDYLGGRQDIAGLASVCHDFHIPLLVDNAHGAYLKFLSPSQHPLDLGADLCCDSAHKTLPALTGCAYLHVGRQALYPFESLARESLSLFGSTSPSYLLLQSLDCCNAILAECYHDRLKECIQKREAACTSLLQHGFCLYASDPLRIVFDSAAMEYSGLALANYLRYHQMECEFANQDYVVLMVTPETSDKDWDKLATLTLPEGVNTKNIQEQDTKRCKRNSARYRTEDIVARTPKKGIPLLSIRQALFARSKRLPLEQSLGRICAAPAVSCPPAIPVVISGELITKDVIKLCQYYHITSLLVVAEES